MQMAMGVTASNKDDCIPPKRQLWWVETEQFEKWASECGIPQRRRRVKCDVRRGFVKHKRDGQRNRWRICCILILDSTIRAVMLTFVWVFALLLNPPFSILMSDFYFLFECFYFCLFDMLLCCNSLSLHLLVIYWIGPSLVMISIILTKKWFCWVWIFGSVIINHYKNVFNIFLIIFFSFAFDLVIFHFHSPCLRTECTQTAY